MRGWVEERSKRDREAEEQGRRMPRPSQHPQDFWMRVARFWQMPWHEFLRVPPERRAEMGYHLVAQSNLEEYEEHLRGKDAQLEKKWHQEMSDPLARQREAWKFKGVKEARS